MSVRKSDSLDRSKWSLKDDRAWQTDMVSTRYKVQILICYLYDIQPQSKTFNIKKWKFGYLLHLVTANISGKLFQISSSGSKFSE